MNSKKKRTIRRCALVVLLTVLPLGFLATVAWAGEESDSDEDVIVLGGQNAWVDADGNRDAKFEKNRDIPSGIVLNFAEWSHATGDSWIQIKAWDTAQDDQRFLLRSGLGKYVTLRATYQNLPYRYGDQATFPLGRGANDMYGTTFRVGDFIQKGFQDPDGDNTDFYTSGSETTGDNALVRNMANDFLAGFDQFNLYSHRSPGSVELTFKPADNWRFGVDAHHETRDGTQALGSGTYQRITDVNGDGITDYDYFFSIRGIELPAIIDYRTTRVGGFATYQQENWFFNVAGNFSNFENAFRGITYDNPFWFDGVDATSGSRRGLWEEGRVSLEPSNEAWNFDVSGGVNLPAKTRITAGVSFGEHSQDESFLPFTTNPALRGTADLNRDGIVDGRDDPTRAPGDVVGMPATIGGVPVIGSSLNGSSDTTGFNFTITSKPVNKLTLTGRYRYYNYEGTEGTQVIPGRAEYIESHIKTDFKGDMILHVPLDFTRDTVDLEAAYRFCNWFKAKGFYKRKGYDYNRYQDPDGNTSRDSGTRAVESTDDDIFGVTGMFAANGWFSGRVSFYTSDRTYGGTYRPGFSGENSGVRQFDIADRERDAGELQLDFMPIDELSLGFGYRMTSDDYPESVYGLQAGDTMGYTFNINYVVSNGFSVFAYADWAEWDADMHLRTKCSNCEEPPGFASWNVPNYDWFSDYIDTTTSIGGGLTFRPGSSTRLTLSANYTEGVIEQSTTNPGIPTERNPRNPRFGTQARVATGFDFSDQTNDVLTTELKLSHKITDGLSVGVRWLYEIFDLNDFQWDSLEPYGANFLTVDDATRFLFLDSRYRDYDAHVLQAFLLVRF